MTALPAYRFQPEGNLSWSYRNREVNQVEGTSCTERGDGRFPLSRNGLLALATGAELPGPREREYDGSGSLVANITITGDCGIPVHETTRELFYFSPREGMTISPDGRLIADRYEEDCFVDEHYACRETWEWEFRPKL